jgi:hypothetical protein
VKLASSDPRALDGGYRVGRDQSLLHGLTQGRAKHPARLGDRRRRQSSLLHASQHRPDVAGTNRGDLESPDHGRDLPADIALVGLKSQGPNASGTLVPEPSDKELTKPDPLGAGICPSLDQSDELAQGAFGLFLRCEATFALLAPPPGDGMRPDVHNELPRPALSDMPSHDPPSPHPEHRLQSCG